MLKSTRIHADDFVKAASDRCVGERSARMAIVDTTDRSVRTVADLRRSRRALRAESARLGRWRRLVRARMDLALAASMAPEPLGLEALGLLPPHVGDDLPMYNELLEAVQVGRGGDEVRRLERLRDFEARLTRYQVNVEATLEATTAEFVRRLSFDPGASLEFLGNNR